jgi:D-alanyl-D-alanine carboxypeptidase/D-alanyl-D-alanine-endopeptidase (penicillin-binding protein 4)
MATGVSSRAGEIWGMMNPYVFWRRRPLPLILCACLAWWFGSVSQARSDETGQGRDPDLVRAIDAALDNPGIQTGFQGIVIQSLTDGTLLYTRNPDKVFLPASNNKLLTSGIALATLGSDYVWRTRLYRIGPLTDEGVVQGDLVLRGAGDPILTSEDLDDMVQQALRAGVRSITGNLYYDDSLFDRQRLGDLWAWDDEPYYYSAQISALNLDENLVTLQAKPGRKVGARVQVTVTPTQRYVRLQVSAVTGPAKSKYGLIFDRVRGQNLITVSGTLPIDVAAADNPAVRLTIEDPSRFTALVLAERLRQAGIAILGGVRDGSPVPANTPVVAEHESIPLAQMLRRLNKPSDNLIAECLLKTVGAERRQQGTSGEEGTGEQEARTWFAKIGLDVSRLHIVDGSGLSRVDFVSPRNLVRLLAYIHTQPYFSILYDSLPIAGVDGTLYRRMRGTAAEKNCHGKTGYVSHVSSLSGYVTTRDGEMLAFSILMNNYLAPVSQCTAAQDKIVELLANYTRR